MKNMLGMFKNRDSEHSAVTENSDYSNEIYEPEGLENEENEPSNDVFEEFTDKVQSLLDNGAMSLEIAEEKTAQLEELDPSSEDYAQLVEEVKTAQAEARQSFDDAEFLIQRANEILENNAN